MSAVTDRLNDFPDRFSPMLVKELRQGLRAKTFVIVFLVLQGILALILLTASAAGNPDRVGQFVSSIIFVFFSLAVLVIQPLRGVAALSSEIRGNTIDLMVLTRLSAMRIVLGKWVAIVGQSALLLSTIIPYLILRYYFGGMQLFAELLLVLLIFLFSAALTAVTVGISASRSILLRGLWPIFGATTLTIGIFNLGFDNELRYFIEELADPSQQTIGALVGMLVVAAHAAYCALSLGASLIAPLGENLATAKRLISLVAIVVGGIVLRLTLPDPEPILAFFIGMIVPAVIPALSETHHPLPSLDQPFERAGIFGSIGRLFLYPGWPSGVAYLLVLIASAMALLKIGPDRMNKDLAIVGLSFLGVILFPAALLALFGKHTKERVSALILGAIASAIFGGVMAMLSEAMSTRSFLWFFIWDPIVFLPMTSHYYSESKVIAAAILVNAFYLTILVVCAVAASRRFTAETLRIPQEA